LISFCTPDESALKRLHPGKIDPLTENCTRHDCDGCLLVRWISPSRLLFQQIQRGGANRPPNPAMGIFPHASILSALQSLPTSEHFRNLSMIKEDNDQIDPRHEAEAAGGGGPAHHAETKKGASNWYAQIKRSITTIEQGWLQPGFRQLEQQSVTEASSPVIHRTLSNGVLSIYDTKGDPRALNRRATTGINLARTDFAPWQATPGDVPVPKRSSDGPRDRQRRAQLTRSDSQRATGTSKPPPHLVNISHTVSDSHRSPGAQHPSMHRSVTWAFSEWPNNLDLQALVDEMRGVYGVKLSNRRQWMTLHTKCFEGSILVDWVIQNMPEAGRDRKRASKVGQLLLQHGHIQHVRGEYMFRDNHDFYRFAVDAGDGNVILNQYEGGEDFPIASNASLLDPIVVAESLAAMAVSLIAPFTNSKSTNEFERGLQQQRDSPAFKIFEEQATNLSRTNMDNSNWNREQRLSFWINVYNVMVVHIYLRRGLSYTAKQRRQLVTSSQYIVSGHLLTLGEVAYILRGGVSPAQRIEIGNGKNKVFMPEVNFGKADPRKSLILQPYQTERLVVFALATGTLSGAVLRVYRYPTTHNRHGQCSVVYPCLFSSS